MTVTPPSTIPPLPSGVTHPKVYDTVAPDGPVGGSAHVHLYDAPDVRFFSCPTAQLGGSEPVASEEPTAGRPREQGVADAFYQYIVRGIEREAVSEMLVRSARDKRPVDREELEVD